MSRPESVAEWFGTSRPRQLMGLEFTATDEEQRRVLLAFSRSPEARELATANALHKMCDWADPQLAARAVAADIACIELAARLIDEMIAARKPQEPTP